MTAMANIHRGEIDAELDGAPMRLVLTLGALAELEAAFGAGDLVTLAERFERGTLSARDVMAVLGAGLRGAGHVLSDDEVARLRCTGGAPGYLRIVSRLLAATFGGAGENEDLAAGQRPESGTGGPDKRPFPGAR
jgi:hypothetical protein